VYSTKEFAQAAKDFVLVKMNGEKGQGPDLMTRYGVSGFPTIKFLNKDGEVVHEMVGYRPVEGFIAEMRKALQK
jgi:thioredoxin-related protein